MMRRILFFIALFCLTFASKGMQESKFFCRELLHLGQKTKVTIEKKGTVKSLTEDEHTKIFNFSQQLSISNEQKEQLYSDIYDFIGNPRIEPSITFYDFVNYTYNNYIFKRFIIKKGKLFSEVTEEHCQAIARWLAQNNIDHTHNRQQVSVINQGRYFLLSADDISLYQQMAVTPIRKKAMKKKNIIACVAIKEDQCEDITDEGLSSANLKFHSRLVENN